jgi:hypothetical protein
VLQESFGKLNWYGIGGHSLGGRAGAGLCGALGIHKDVTWGPGSSVYLLPSDTSALVVLTGTNDGLAAVFHMNDQVPVKTIKIEGGNHAGFAHYGPHTQNPIVNFQCRWIRCRVLLLLGKL